ncbi:tRNA-guanine transglycosylase DpdA [Brevibacillus sp. MS2.2]|uniref:tRNA-guanine transglycosylase DpdA n=1 Tax=Brevibacillus sp. MS2.2 TaxID=2738981 RepID=UPI00156B854B|nr:tRNA-guanine transglycosylase DpdA [Brevibacillus sp. MS2.2]NRR19753.1 queuine/other tRNA-ribosyltransferase [Brevibacillus sp. MS2.2]
MTKRILVVTSCTGEKIYKPENQLVLDDFVDKQRLRKREKELKNYKVSAGEMYTGSQHLALMEGVKNYRFNGGTIDVSIISAGYGLLDEGDFIVPYEVTFNTMNSQTVKNWSKQQGISEQLQDKIQNYDLVFFLLGDKYLQSVLWPLSIRDNQRFIFFAGGSSKSKILLEDRYHVLTIGEKEAKEFKFGLIGIKGFLFSQLLKQVSKNIIDDAWNEIAESPEKVRNYILQSLGERNTQLTLFETLVADNQILQFFDELFPVSENLYAKSFKSEFKFFMPENDDRVDPNYDFTHDYSEKNRNPLLNDVYAHEIYGTPQYDGVLVSKVNIDNATRQKRALIEEVGMHEFLRLPPDYPIMGDCGAFSYIDKDVPPYTTDEIIKYYHDLGFDYGVSIDHLIVGPFQKDENIRNLRYELTLSMAEEFMDKFKANGAYKFHPIGIVQGWDPISFRKAVQHLINLGYDYIALGGLAREQSEKIYEILKEISPYIPDEKFRMHLFGVARDMRTMRSFHKLGVTSFDSSSPLRRAWLGTGHNYHTADGKHYTAIRIPEAKETAGRVKKMIKEGKGEFQDYKNLEQEAINALRKFSAGEINCEKALTAILKYDEMLGDDREVHEDLYRELLLERPWEKCGCKICQSIGIDVIVFRGNNRNRRRGFHNTFTYYSQLKQLRHEFE